MRSSFRVWIFLCLVASFQTLVATREASAQAFGIELHNTVMPASGGMAGASLARPQDVQSALNGNPATLAKFKGNYFGFGGGWVEATYNVSHTGGVIPAIGAFSAKSNAQGAALGNIVATQDLRPLGIPGTMGMGLISSSGAGVSFRRVAASNGTSAMIQALQIVPSIGVELTENLSAGANIMLGSATLDGPFVSITGAAYDYALRGSAGLTYEAGEDTTLSAYYQTIQSFVFDEAVNVALMGGGTLITSIDADLPDNVGVGIANESLMDGKLLLAFDVLYKQWANADLFKSIYENQWVFQFGAQYTCNQYMKLRMGYAYTDNIMKANPGGSAGGVSPVGGQAAIEYVQAQFAAINKHRISGGVGIEDLLPGVDFDLFAGGMFGTSNQFGPFTSASVASYWIGAGITWHFDGSGAEMATMETY